MKSITIEVDPALLASDQYFRKVIRAFADAHTELQESESGIDQAAAEERKELDRIQSLPPLRMKEENGEEVWYAGRKKLAPEVVDLMEYAPPMYILELHKYIYGKSKCEFDTVNAV